MFENRLESKRSSTRWFFLFFRKLTYHTLGKLKNHLPKCRLRGDLLVPRRVPRLFLPLVHQRFSRRPSKGKLRDVHPELTDEDEGVEDFLFFSVVFFCWKKTGDVDRDHWWDPTFGESNLMQIYGNFERYSLLIVQVWVGNTMTPVFWILDHSADGRNNAPVDMVVYPIIFRVL